MNFSVKTTKMLWGRAAGMCSICRKRLFIDATETDDETLIGEMCHMVAQEEGGPRGRSSMTPEERIKYANLILLCRDHHKIIDSQYNEYTVEKLIEIKTTHEQWVESQLLDKTKQKNDERVAGYIDEWARLSHLDEWEAWTSHVLGGGLPTIWREVFDDISKLRKWMFNRIWPEGYADIKSAFQNFRLVLADFVDVFSKHIDREHSSSELYTKQFYKIDEWNEEEYNRLHSLFEHHVDLVQDLVLELTRAANLLAQRVREGLSPDFRIDDGLLTISSGPHFDFRYHRHLVSYSTEDVEKGVLYPGLEQFLTERATRDMYFGVGKAPTR